MGDWMIVINFTADNREQAEDIAADIIAHTNYYRGNGLYYRDPLDGKMHLWAEPICRHDELEVQRDRS